MRRALRLLLRDAGQNRGIALTVSFVRETCGSAREKAQAASFPSFCRPESRVQILNTPKGSARTFLPLTVVVLARRNLVHPSQIRFSAISLHNLCRKFVGSLKKVRVARRSAGGVGRATAGGICGLADGLLPPKQAANGPFPGDDLAATLFSSLDGQVAKTSNRRAPSLLRRADGGTAATVAVGD